MHPRFDATENGLMHLQKFRRVWYTERMHLLDTPQTFERYDARNLRGSIAMLAEQCEQAWKETRSLAIPLSYTRNIDQVIVAGMGGSALPAHTIAAVFAGALRVPLHVVSTYTLPASATRRSLVILLSYSGTTEEVMHIAQQALQKRIRVIGMTIGGDLAHMLRSRKLPVYQFVPKHNPCGQPRMGQGYMLFGLLGILHRVELLAYAPSAIVRDIGSIRTVEKKYAPTVPFARNDAKKLALFIQGAFPVIIGPDFLLGAMHTFANQVNENAKTFAAFFPLPELNHHFIEGLQFPRTARRGVRFISLTSTHAHPRIRARSHITEAIIRKNRFSVWRHELSGATPFAAALSLLVFGSYASFYAALLHRIDPSAIPWVDYLKKRLAKKKP